MSTNVTRVLNNGSKIPWIGFGTGTALYAKDVEVEVVRALEAGFKHLDGAQIYKNEVCATLYPGMKITHLFIFILGLSWESCC